ncbi:hypothetical protein BGZ98_001040 [Dissophora globulifera]|nr:hypothetical protein BGZ98_001040 [Dissophora globulifera]
MTKFPGYRSVQPDTQMPFILQKISTDDSEQPDDMPIYNVLLIGQSQSGKSTLLEAIKQYGNPDYKPDLSRIGGGNISHTSEPRIEEIVTCLPVYRIFENNRNCRHEIDMERYLEETKFDDFKTLLNRRDGLELTAESSAAFSRFRIIDTPGLDDSGGRDVEFLGRIFSAISSLGHLHLVIITDSHGTTLAPGYQAALQTYSTLFSVMHGLMTFVMTNIPNKQRHPGRKKYPGLDAKLEERADIISRIMGRRFPSFKIDCNLQEHRPAPICITRNIIRDILTIATIKTPVALKMQVQKTPVMKAVDENVHKLYSTYFTNLQRSRDILDAADQLRLEIMQKESEIAIKEDDLQTIDTDELLHLYEVRFSQDWQHFYIIRPTLLQYSTYDCSVGESSLMYPAVEILKNDIDDEMEDCVMENDRISCRETVEKIEEKGKEADGCMIDMVRTSHSAVNILDESGGIGEKCWRVLFRRKSYEKGYYHAILSIKSRNKYRTRISNLKWEIIKLKEDLEKLKQDHLVRLTELKLQSDLTTTAVVDRNVYHSLHSRLSIYRKMMEATKGWHLKLEVFIELAQSGVYYGGSVQASAEALERFWAAKLGFDSNNHSTCGTIINLNKY